MFSTPILDVAVGLFFVYLLLSLACTAAKETIEGWFKKRAKDLEAGIREMLSDPEGKDLAKMIYEHPLIFGLFPGAYAPARSLGASIKKLGRTNLPSYISPRNFAVALMDVVLPPEPQAPGRPLTETIKTIPNAHVRRALLSLANAAENDLTLFRENIETWFNSAMERLSGPYKRFSNVVILLLGVSIAVGLNADTIAIVKGLSQDPQARTQLVAAAEAYQKRQGQEGAQGGAESAGAGTPMELQALMTRLNQVGALGLPIGWNSDDPRTACPKDWLGWALKVGGLLLTAFAISLGAPFWFDLLNKVTSMRSSLKPLETTGGKASQDGRPPASPGPRPARGEPAPAGAGPPEPFRAQEWTVGNPQEGIL